jgi:2-polyprenyl-6-methoxyphenol hydroxylase-like FAD-dependent oxidoreductase
MGSTQELPPKILIIGGGLGGLCLAQGLRKAGVPFHVFERDLNATYRPQGYRLRINAEGANALKQTLTSELWERFENTCAVAEIGETDINAVSGIMIASRAGNRMGSKSKPYTCDRKVLRDILMEGLDETTLSFGKELASYEEGEDGGVVAYFLDGTKTHGSFLVGADGRSSVVRRQFLPEHKLLDTEGMCIYGKTPITLELLERFPAEAMRWMTLVVDSTPLTQTLDVDDTAVTLLLEPIRFARGHQDVQKYAPPDYMYWVLIGRNHMFEGLGNDATAISLLVTQCWDAGIRSILHLQDKEQSSLLRVLSADPGMKSWVSSNRVTVIGDAIHAMSPSGGVGAVSALVDGANLARTIAEKGISPQSIAEFETGMREFAAANIRRSYMGGRKIFGQRPFNECKPHEH